MGKVKRITGITILGLALASLSFAQVVLVDDGLRARLSELDPRVPMVYFELAEEVADFSPEAEHTELAKKLFALAGGLDPQRLGRSSCLALAGLEEDYQRRKRLIMLANMLDRQSLRPQVGSTGELLSRNRPDALAVATAISAYRNGNGQDTIRILKVPARLALLKQVEHLIPGGTDRLLAEAARYQRGKRPMLSQEEINKLLELELALLVNDQRSWGSELLLTQGAPLVEADPSRLAETLGVDINRPYFRDGAWVNQR